MKAQRWLWVSLLIGCSVAAQAQRADGIYSIKCMVQMVDAPDGTRKADCTNHPRENGVIGIKGKIAFDVVTTHELMDQEGAPEVTDLILFIDGQALPGTYPVVESTTTEKLPPGSGIIEEGGQEPDSVVTYRVTFTINRDLTSDKGRENWTKLLSGLGKNRKLVAVSLGLINGPPLPSTYKAEFVRIKAKGLIVFLVVAVVLAIGFLGIAARSGALRDKEPSPPGAAAIAPTARAYSLSRTQIALWTLLVVYAYLFIWFITGEYNTVIPGTILAILGISAGTYGTAAAIDKQKVADQHTTVARSESLTSDLFVGADGADLHRVQFGLWSVVLMIVFVVTVYRTLAMPAFDNSLLGLMGISSAAYAGMKIPEKKQ
ncbi:MAG TPA: hypothetical protein VKW06_17620 [Candidatus Angelobacter sp.]|nr:hypothetical protein [Candidatus Angelobacter sp.]